MNIYKEIKWKQSKPIGQDGRQPLHSLIMGLKFKLRWTHVFEMLPLINWPLLGNFQCLTIFHIESKTSLCWSKLQHHYLVRNVKNVLTVQVSWNFDADQLPSNAVTSQDFNWSHFSRQCVYDITALLDNKDVSDIMRHVCPISSVCGHDFLCFDILTSQEVCDRR